MKISAILASVAALAVASASASAQAPGCQKVSAVGDATYCINGPLCSGTSARKGGDRCPQAGDVAVEACLPSLPSYNKATGKCTAPTWANCQVLPTGAFGCVWNRAGAPAPAPAPTPAVTTPAPTPAHTTTAPVTQVPTPTPARTSPAPTTSAPTPTPARTTTVPTAMTPAPVATRPTVPGCQKVSVVGGATYCVKGLLCSGLVARKGGDRCPQAGDAAVDACRPNLPSYNKATGKCIAPTWANCQVLPTGAWGCVWNRPSGPSPAPIPAVTSTPAPTPARTTTAPVTVAPTPSTTRPTPAPTSITPAPTTASPSGAPAPAPTTTTPAPTTARPSPAPTTTAAPTTSRPTPAPVTTTPAPTPARTTPAPASTTPAPTPARTTPAPAPNTQTPAPMPAKTVNVTAAQNAGYQKVSVVGDATYFIKGPICSGTMARKGGDRCPQAGDVAVEACRPNLPSFDETTGKCTAPVWANCQVLPTGAWGCVWDKSKVPAQAKSVKKALRD